MVDPKIKNDDRISRQNLETVLAEFEKLVQTEINAIDSRIQSEKYAAAESYISDMKGFSRGMSVMGIKALEFFRERLFINNGK